MAKKKKKKDLRFSKNWPSKSSWTSNEKLVNNYLKKWKTTRPNNRYRKQTSEGGMLFRLVGIQKKRKK